MKINPLLIVGESFEGPVNQVHGVNLNDPVSFERALRIFGDDYAERVYLSPSSTGTTLAYEPWGDVFFCYAENYQYRFFLLPSLSASGTAITYSTPAITSPTSGYYLYKKKPLDNPKGDPNLCFSLRKIYEQHQITPILGEIGLIRVAAECTTKASIDIGPIRFESLYPGEITNNCQIIISGSTLSFFPPPNYISNFKSNYNIQQDSNQKFNRNYIYYNTLNDLVTAVNFDSERYVHPFKISLIDKSSGNISASGLLSYSGIHYATSGASCFALETTTTCSISGAVDPSTGYIIPSGSASGNYYWSDTNRPALSGMASTTKFNDGIVDDTTTSEVGTDNDSSATCTSLQVDAFLTAVLDFEGIRTLNEWRITARADTNAVSTARCLGYAAVSNSGSYTIEYSSNGSSWTAFQNGELALGAVEKFNGDFGGVSGRYVRVVLEAEASLINVFTATTPMTGTAQLFDFRVNTSSGEITSYLIPGSSGTLVCTTSVEENYIYEELVAEALKEHGLARDFEVVALPGCIGRNFFPLASEIFVEDFGYFPYRFVCGSSGDIAYYMASPSGTRLDRWRHDRFHLVTGRLITGNKYSATTDLICHYAGILCSAASRYNLGTRELLAGQLDYQYTYTQDDLDKLSYYSVVAPINSYKGHCIYYGVSTDKDSRSTATACIRGVYRTLLPALYKVVGTVSNYLLRIAEQETLKSILNAVSEGCPILEYSYQAAIVNQELLVAVELTVAGELTSIQTNVTIPLNQARVSPGVVL
jgi:hypothetical protein